MVAVSGVLALLALVDAVAVGFGWPLAVFLTVTALAAGGVLAGERGRRDAATAAAVATSLAGTFAIVIAGGADFGLVETLALLLLLVPRWRFAATRREWVLAGVVAVALVVLPSRLGGPDALVFTVLMVAGVAAAVAVATALRGQDVHRRAAVSAVRRAEREEVARELHDVVAHHVTGIVVATQAARTVAHADPGAVAAALDSIEAAGAEALTSMRRLVGVLRSEPGLETGAGGERLPTPGLGDLADLVHRFRGTGAAVAVHLHLQDGSLSAVPVEVQSAAYRVVQESLTNVRRHARGTERVSVDVVRAGEDLVVVVTDSGGRSSGDAPDGASDGPSRNVPPEVDRRGGGFGVVGMRERVEALGGTLSAGPRGSGGWAVRAVVPLDALDAQRSTGTTRSWRATKTSSTPHHSA